MNAALALQQAMRTALLANSALTTLLGGAHIYDEVPRGEPPLYVVFNAIETRDWSTTNQKAHEHFVTLEIMTNERGRAMAQAICNVLEATLDNAPLVLTDHKLVNLRTTFWNVARNKSNANYTATVRFRAATEPL